MRQLIQRVVILFLPLLLTGCLGFKSEQNIITSEETTKPFNAGKYSFQIIDPKTKIWFSQKEYDTLEIENTDTGYILKTKDDIFPENMPFFLKSIGDDFYILSSHSYCLSKTIEWCNYLVMLKNDKMYLWTEFCKHLDSHFGFQLKKITNNKGCKSRSRTNVTNILKAMKDDLMKIDESLRHYSSGIVFFPAN